MIESPKVGDRVRVTLEGNIQHRQGSLVAVGAGPFPAEFRLDHACVKSVEVLTPPDPWDPGDIVIDASGTVWQRAFGEPVWYSPGREDPVSQDRLAAPLTLLVRDGLRILTASQLFDPAPDGLIEPYTGWAGPDDCHLPHLDFQ